MEVKLTWHTWEHPVTILTKFDQNRLKYVETVANLRVARRKKKKKKKKKKERRKNGVRYKS